MISLGTEVQAVTRGFAEDTALRKRYEEDGFGLEAVFEKRAWAEGRISDLQETYGLSEEDTRLVKHISTPASGQKTAWEVYVKIRKGLRILFL